MLSIEQLSEFGNQNVENQHSGILARLKTNEFTLENKFFDLDLYRITSALLDGIK